MSFDIHPEHTRVEPEEKPRLIIPVLLWLAILGVLIGSGVILTGCAQTEFAGVCVFDEVGKTDQGFVVARTYCKARE